METYLIKSELDNLYIERDAINRMSNSQVVEQYNCDYKKEMLNLIQEEIDSLEKKLNDERFDYTDEELEYERTQLCYSQGISRYC